MGYYSHITPVLLLILPLIGASKASHAIISTAESGEGAHDGYPATYRGEGFNVTIEAVLDLTYDPQDVVITLQLPGSEGSSQSCQNTVDGKTISCETKPEIYTPCLVDYKGIVVETGSNIDLGREPVVSKLGSFTVIIKLDNAQAVNTSVDTAKHNTVSLTFDTEIDVEYPDQTVEFFTTVEGAFNNYTTDTLTVRAIGPFLGYDSWSSPSSDAESGSVIDFSITVLHAESSTAPALNPHMSLLWSQGSACPFVEGTVVYQQTGGPSIALTLTRMEESEDTPISLSALSAGDTVVLAGQRVCADDVLVGRSIEIRVGVDYNNAAGSTFTADALATSLAKPLKWTDPTTKLTKTFNSGGEFSIQRTFHMPLGKLTDLNVYADFTTESMGVIPFTFQRGSVVYDTSRVSHRGTELLTADHEDFTQSKSWPETPAASRRKRRLQYLSRKRRGTESLQTNCEFGTFVNPRVGGVSGTPVTLEMKFAVLTSNQGGNVSADVGVRYSGVTQYFDRLEGVVTRSVLKLEKRVELVNKEVLPNIVRFTTIVSHANFSIGPAYDVSLEDGSMAFEIFFGDEMVGPIPGSPQFQVVGEKLMTWTSGGLENSEQMVLSYKAQPINKGEDLPHGDSVYTAQVDWNSSPGGKEVLGPVAAACCIRRVDVIQGSVFYLHGFTALGVFVGLVIGFVAIFVLLFVLWRAGHFQPSSTVRPYTVIDHNTFYGRQFVTGSRGTRRERKKTWRDPREVHRAAKNQSLVRVLTKKSKLQQHRELDNLDVGTSINVDMDIEAERDKAMIHSTIILVRSLKDNGDVDENDLERVSTDFRERLAQLEKEKDAEHRNQMDQVFNKLGKKKKQKLQELLEKHQEEKDELNETLNHLTDTEQQEVQAILDEQHTAELEEVDHLLDLDQDEEVEKLRKVFTIRWRMTIKSQQQDYLDDIRTAGKLTDEQLDWLMKEHYSNQASLDKLFDDSMSRQRMLLEEKLARRKALAQSVQLQGQNQTEKMNMMTQHQISAVEQAKKDGVLSAEKAEELVEQVKTDAKNARDKMEEEKTRQQDALHKKLSERKKAKMAEMSKRHKAELGELEKKRNSLRTNSIDPVSGIEARQTLVSHQRQELAELENELEREQADELMKLRQQVVKEELTDMENSKDKIIGELGRQGMQEDQIAKVLNQHEEDLTKLAQKQEENKQAQMEKLKKSLAARQHGLAATDNAEIQQHQENMAREMLHNQVAMSDEEREQIMLQHKENMAKMEHSLTLNKMQQRRILEEKLARKRALHLEKLEVKQARESKKDDSSEDGGDGGSPGQQIEMLKEHARQRMDVMVGDELTMDDDMKEVHVDMMKERTAALKEQEVKLATMLADIQMAKAKELAEIKSQEKAIGDLKSKLLDDVMEDEECQHVLELHQQEREALNTRLDDQRIKQENAMKERLHERLRQREAQMNRMQQQEMSETIGPLGKQRQTTSAKLKKAALMAKHQQQVGAFRQKMEKELAQTLEEARRQSNIKRIEYLKDQELQLLNGMVRLGKFDKGQIQKVVCLLFPKMSDGERTVLINQLLEGC